MRNCSHCKTENPEDAKFCKKCGHSFELKCPKCGVMNSGDASFCVQCGTPLEPQKRKRKKMILIVVGAILAVLILGLITTLICTYTHQTLKETEAKKRQEVEERKEREEEQRRKIVDEFVTGEFTPVGNFNDGVRDNNDTIVPAEEGDTNSVKFRKRQTNNNGFQTGGYMKKEEGGEINEW